MRRGLLLLTGLGLLGLIGCSHHCAGKCDCLVYPLEHGTPCPFTKPASAETIHPVPAANTPAPQ